MNKKILIGAGIVTLLILIGGFWWLMRGEEAGEGGFRNLFPFGQSDTFPDLSSENSSQLPTIQTENVQTGISAWEELRLISRNAVSGATFLSNGTSTVIRFVERATGHIFDANLESGAIERISNTTIPKIERVAWRPGGNGFVGQFLDADTSIVQTKAVEITATTTESGYRRVDDFFLPENILEIDASPQGNQLFYLARGMRGVEGIRTGARGENPSVIWQFPTSEWISEWRGANLISLTSKAGNGIPGFLYTLNPGNGATSIVLSGIEGLTARMAPSGRTALYSSNNGQQFSLRFLDRERKIDVQLPFNTFPEKCVWNADETIIYCAVPQATFGTLPDEWYQGIVSFNDTLWKIDFSTEEMATQVSALSTTGERFDVISPKLSPDGQFLLFMNKKDLSLWAVALERPQ